MSNSRRQFIQQSVLAAGTAAFVTGSSMAEASFPANITEPVTTTNKQGESTMADQTSTGQQVPAGTTNVFGGDHFDPSKWLIVPAKTFDDLKVGDVFRCPSRTLTDAHTSEFQAVSTDTHPRHYNAPYAQAHNMPTMLIQPFQLLDDGTRGIALYPLRRRVNLGSQRSLLRIWPEHLRWRHGLPRP